MAKSKKPKKKYVPIPVRYPSLVTRINSFAPFEAALDRLLDKGEVEVDEAGMLVFKDGAGNTQSFVSSLKVYIDIINIYCSHNNLTYDVYPLYILQNRLFEAISFEEEEIIKARECLEVCKDIIGKIPPNTLFSILNTVRVGMAVEKTTEHSLKNPEMTLFALKFKAGDLTYEDVVERHKKYQDLALEDPSDEHYIKLRDFYVEFYSAYNFYRQQQLSKI